MARSSGPHERSAPTCSPRNACVVPTSTSARRPTSSRSTNPSTGQPQQVLGIGQKSGDYWALNPDDGGVVWRTKVGPGGLGGGVEWGTATDGERIYVAEANTSRRPFTLSGTGPFAGTTVTSGYWSALNPATGAILWQTPDPQGSKDPGFVTTANGVVYVGSAAGSGGNMYALDGTHRRGPVEFRERRVGVLGSGGGARQTVLGFRLHQKRCVPEWIQLVRCEQQAVCVRSSLSRYGTSISRSPVRMSSSSNWSNALATGPGFPSPITWSSH